MKKTNFKKALSVFLSVLILMSCWVFVPGEHNHVSAASKKMTPSALAVIYNGSGDRANSSRIVICSDGAAGNTTVGILKFDISVLPNVVTNANLSLNVGNHGGYIPSEANFYLVNPSTCTDATTVGQSINNIGNVYKSYTGTTGASNALSYFGISGNTALGTVKQNETGVKTFNITSAVNQAKANGWSYLCLVFIMPKAFSNNGDTGWSDLHINTSNTYLQVEYEGAYGMPQASYEDNRTGYIQTHQKTDGTDYLNVYYPSEIYLDKSESLEDAGYKVYLSGNYGSGDNYRTLVFSSVWGGSYDRDNGVLKNTTMLEMFDNYTYYTSDEVNVNSGKDNYSIDGSNWVVNFKGSSTGFSATVNLQGTPKSSKIGQEATFDARNNNTATPLVSSMTRKGTFGWPSHDSDGGGAWMGDSNVTGQVKIKVTLYNKEALNQTYQKSLQIYDINAPYGDYITAGLETYLGYHNTSTPTLLKTRKTNQSAINTENSGFENAIKGLVFNANNSALVAAMNSAKAIIDEADYTKKYTADSRSALETAYNNAVNSAYDTSVPKYQITNLGDSSTWNVGKKAADDQIAINNLTDAINDVTMQIQSYTVTFNFANGSSDTNTYNYGTTITAPSNSTKQPDATNHYSYTWSPAVSTTVTDNATYSEVLNTEAHDWGAGWTSVLAGDCITDGKERRSCTVCGYTEEKNTGKDNSVHNDTADFAQTDATCTTDGYTAGTYCYNCSQWISGHEVIPAAHTPGAEATCTAPQTCTVCGAELAAKLAHTEVVIPAVPATCTTPGKTEGKQCSVCGTVTVAPQDTELAAHTEATKEENRVEASCGADGSYVLVTYCSECSTEIKRENKTIPATGNHTLGNWIIDTDATCVTPGSQHKECANCDYETTAEAIPATGKHVYGDWAQYGDKHRRTCTADIACTAAEEEAHNFNGELRQMDGGNYHQYKCEKCEAYGVGSTLNIGEACFGDSVTFEQIADNASQHKEICKCGREKNDGHAYGSWVADPENKDNNQGKMSRICSECSYKQTSDCTYTVIDEKAATCTEDGYKTWKCSDCGNGYSEILKSPGHDWDEGVVITQPTCTTPGEKIFTCKANASHTRSEDVAIDADNHEGYNTEVARVDSTCNTKGSVTMKCACGDEETTELELDASNHTNLVKTDANAATCENVGNIAYWTCEGCGKIYSDEAATTEIQIEATVVPAINHAWTVSYEWSADGKSCVATRSCANDSTHNLTANATVTGKVTTPATCEGKGTTTYTATFTEDWAAEQTNKVVDIPAINHEWTVSYEWSANGKSCVATRSFANDSTHNLTANATVTGEVTTPATCEGKGTTTYTATFTEDWAVEQTKKVIDIPALNHEWTVSYEWSADGKSCVATRSCANDSTHNLTANATVTGKVTTPATCEGKGTTTYTATFIEDWAAEQTNKVIDIPALNHDYDTTKSEANLTRPVFENGAWTDGYYTYKCKNDSAHTTTEKVERADYTAYDVALANLNALLATDITGTAREAVEAAIEANQVADNLIASEQLSIDAKTAALEKAFEDNKGSLQTYKVTFKIDGSADVIVNVISGQDATAPTNVKKDYDENNHYNFDGWDKAFNNVTSDLTVTAQFEAVAHSYTHTDKDDTYHTDKCACGYSIDVEHTETSEVTTKASCFADGVRTYTCSVCGGTRTEKIAKRTHHIVDTEVALAPTCSATGTMNQKCDNAATDEYEACTYTTTRVIDIVADAHSFGDWTQTKAPTCTAVGTEERVCAHNAAHKETRDVAISADAHSFGDWTQTKAPTCSAVGTEERVCVHNAAHKETRDVAISADAHSFGDWTQTKAPTCSAVGTEERVCAHNAAHKETRTVAINAAAHTGTASVTKNYREATCKADGYTGDIYWSCCDKLSAKGSTIPALEHIDKNNDNLCDYNCGTEMNTCKHEGTPKQYITNLGENGKLNTHKIKCLACGQIVKIENCDFDTKVVAPSCYEEGYTKYTCKICTYSFVSDFEEKTEHDFGEWESNNATCHEIQSMSRRCKNTKCLYKETVKIIDENTGKYAYGAHSLVVVPGKDATCTKAGYTSYSICIYCEEVTGSKPIPAKGHVDEDGNGNCDVCDSLMGSNGVCGCFCHNDSFFGKIIFKILNFFWKLFKINANCECGVKHW